MNVWTGFLWLRGGRGDEGPTLVNAAMSYVPCMQVMSGPAEGILLYKE